MWIRSVWLFKHDRITQYHSIRRRIPDPTYAATAPKPNDMKTNTILKLLMIKGIRLVAAVILISMCGLLKAGTITLEHSFSSAFSAEAADYLEPDSTLVPYWAGPSSTWLGPDAFRPNVRGEGRMTYHYMLDGSIISAYLQANVWTNFGSAYYSYAQIWASTDDIQFVELIEAGAGYYNYADYLPSELLGGSELYIQFRVRSDFLPGAFAQIDPRWDNPAVPYMMRIRALENHAEVPDTLNSLMIVLPLFALLMRRRREV